jgi:hypothetical protein
VLDNYIKLDEILAQFFALLDKQVGKNNYTVFLTADHAVAPIPAYAQKHKMPAGAITDNGVKTDIGKKRGESILAKLIKSLSTYENITIDAIGTAGFIAKPEREKRVRKYTKFVNDYANFLTITFKDYKGQKQQSNGDDDSLLSLEDQARKKREKEAKAHKCTKECMKDGKCAEMKKKG